MSDRFSYVVGDGKRTKFWNDRWFGDLPLDVAFPSLFSRAMAKEAWVGDLWSYEYGGGCWNPVFSRSFNDWEMEDVESFLGRIGEKRVTKGVEDTIRWVEAKNGMFSIKSMYNVLQQRSVISFPWKCIWKNCVQPKVSFFAWEASWGKILTFDQLKRRGFSLTNRCPPCQRSEETMDHLLLHCTMTRVLWDLLFSLFGVSWVLLASVRDSLLGWKGSFLAKDRRKVWKAGPLCIF